MIRLAPRTTAIIRKTAFAAAAALTAATAVATMTAAAAAAAAATAIHKATCTSTTLTIYHTSAGKAAKECFAGAGTIAVLIPDVTKITTGANAGSARFYTAGSPHVTYFEAGEKIPVKPRSELTFIDVTRTWPTGTP